MPYIAHKKLYIKCTIYMLFGLLVYGFFIEPYLVIINNVHIASDNLSGRLKKYIIVQISDLHISKIGIRERKVIKILKDINPDIVFITGDSIAWGNDFGPALEFLKNVSAKIGVWGVLGNADYSNAKGMCVLCHEPDSKLLLKKSPVMFLRNSMEMIEIKNLEKPDQYFQIAIMGVDDLVTGRAELELLSSKVPEEVPKILLSHSSDIFDEAEQYGIDLVLAGHTHGGQILFAGPLLNSFNKLGLSHDMKYLEGLYRKNKSVMYVNSGIGTSILPVRIGVPPEITVFSFN